MKPKDTPKQYVIYSRKSKFTGKGESIENQIELCRQYIAMHFGEDAAENVLVYEDEGFSGSCSVRELLPERRRIHLHLRYQGRKGSSI